MIRSIAYYLPQFHQIPENDAWSEPGFTEWTHVKAAKALFPGHDQPRRPGELGYYDILSPELRQKQADLAREYGIEGFCYWYYWFGYGKKLLEKPLQEVLKTGSPNFPFCIAWANESWRDVSPKKAPTKILVEQLYPGIDDYKALFYDLLPLFRDARYITVNSKPLVVIYKPKFLPDATVFIELFRKLAVQEGLKGIYFVANSQNEKIYDYKRFGFDAITVTNHTKVHDLYYNKILKRKLHRARCYIRKYMKWPQSVYSYKEASQFFLEDMPKDAVYFPSVVPGWDNTPRWGTRGIVLTSPAPELFKQNVKRAVEKLKGRITEERIIFIKSWNEWAEGNYLEPDKKFGRQFLEAFKQGCDA